MKPFLVIGNVVLCGFFTFFVSLFLAGGGIGENVTGKTYVTPQFFLILPVWTVGALFVWGYCYKQKLQNTSYPEIIFINILLWATLPVGFIFSGMLLGMRP
ncbi:hypothetical protein BEP19_03475 [Ammoniphilus oxalaticus]|uniref:Uncharacterized protein n=1 Tax=Ammoniphilus oxalaticus TaxID=66863 RepID=A0A419SP66_9BACL|nr:hypothetical protein BEP19_03475 [Ammoniphilus oxalaticus]